MKRYLLPAAATVVTLWLLAVGVELMATAYVWATSPTYVSARDRFASTTNTFIEGVVRGDSQCGYVDTLFPHPYLGFVHHANPPCGIRDVNNIGLFGANFPSVRPDDRFLVLLTGGSVAAQFASGVDGGPSYLERLLNERFISPTGKPFLVLNGGDGAWKQPQQAILFLLYADAVHAVVTLDGFNEHYMLQSSARFEYPANNFHLVNPLASQQVGDVMFRWVAGRLRSAARSNAVLSRSQAAYEFVSAIEQYAARRAAARPQPRTSIETIFAQPPGWPAERRKTWAIEQYQKYMLAMSAVAKQFGVLSAHFIQPTPAVGKPLTEDERRVVGDLSYGPLYSEMAGALVELTDRGATTISLLHIFDRDTRTLYGDPIHLIRASDGRSVGYEQMADRMATELGRLWRLQPTSGRAPVAP
jgi:hypothetical protein